MNKRTKRIRKAHNIATRNTPKTNDGARRKDKVEFNGPQYMRRYQDQYGS